MYCSQARNLSTCSVTINGMFNSLDPSTCTSTKIIWQIASVVHTLNSLKMWRYSHFAWMADPCILWMALYCYSHSSTKDVMSPASSLPLNMTNLDTYLVIIRLWHGAVKTIWRQANFPMVSQQLAADDPICTAIIIISAAARLDLSAPLLTNRLGELNIKQRAWHVTDTFLVEFETRLSLQIGLLRPGNECVMHVVCLTFTDTERRKRWV